MLVKLRFLRGVPLFDALVRGESPYPATPKLPHKKLDTLGYHMVKSENAESLSDPDLIRYRVVTHQRDRQTDRQTESP